MSAANEQESLWTVEETARYLHMSTAWVYRRVEAGDIPFAKLGRVYRFHPARVREYAEQLESRSRGAKVIPLPKRGGR